MHKLHENMIIFFISVWMRELCYEKGGGQLGQALIVEVEAAPMVGGL